MPNSLADLAALQLRLCCQWLELSQQILRGVGIWGRDETVSVPPPALLQALAPRRGGCVGAADLKR